MKIVHVGVDAEHPRTGVDTTVLALTAGLEAMGGYEHEYVRMRDVASWSRGPAMKQSADLVHFHSMFMPSLAEAAVRCRRARMPYFATPHGLTRSQLARGRRSKLLYLHTVERIRFTGARDVFAVVAEEERILDRLLRGDKHPTLIYNPVQAELLTSPSQQRPIDGPIVYIGRIDANAKGLDRFLSVAEAMPDRRFIVCGWGPDEAMLRARAAHNVALVGPLYGDAKRELLDSAAVLLHLARWEAGATTVLEAFARRRPVVISSDCALAWEFLRHGLGFVVSGQTASTVIALRRALVDSLDVRNTVDRAAAWSARTTTGAFTAYHRAYGG